MTTPHPVRDRYVKEALEEGKAANARAVRYAKDAVDALVGKSVATDADIQVELLRYAGNLDEELLVKMWAELAFGVYDE